MLSKGEMEFLKGIKQITPEYARFLKHSINKKLQELEAEIPILSSHELTKERLMNIVSVFPNGVRENSNSVREFSNRNLPNSGFESLNSIYVAGPTGFEPATFGLLPRFVKSFNLALV